VTRRGMGLTVELARITVGRSSVLPTPRDRRFADEAWTGNPLLRRLVQAYLVSGKTATTLVEDARLDWASAQRIEFAELLA
jgi:polyhydroxyalkanoate synthase